MSFRTKAKKLKKDLGQRHEESILTKDETGSEEFGTVFKKKELKESGMELWRPDYGEHLIDIIPFFCGKNNPRVERERLCYVIDMWVHKSTNPPFVCQLKNFKCSDPICDYIKKERPQKAEYKLIAPKRRTVYLVWVHDTPEEEEKGLQIWEVAHFFFEKKVAAIAKSPKGGAPIIFSDMDNGKSIAFEIQKSGVYMDASGTERDSQEWIGHRFIDRDEPIPDEILEQSFALDDIIDMHPDEETVYKTFHGDTTKEEEEDEAEEPEEEEEDEADEEEEEEDEADEEEEEEEPEEEESKAGTQECPLGAKFGVECDIYEECDDCDLYDDCSDESNRLIKLKKAKKKVADEKKPTVVKKKKPSVVRRKK